MSLILCDTGPLVALIDRDDPAHERCVSALARLPKVPLRTTWPCLVEAMYLLGRLGGLAAHDELWGFLADGLVLLHASDAAEVERMRTLMRQYHDTPMDLADASVVAAAEAMNVHRVFTLDRHFHAYRIDDLYAFEVVP